MNFLKRGLCCLLISICLLSLSACDYKNEQAPPEDNNTNIEEPAPKKYNLLTTLDKNSFKHYISDSTIHTSEYGYAITVEGLNINAGFRWDLSKYNFKKYTEYKVVFENLVFSQLSKQTLYTCFFKLNWSDAGSLIYYNTKTQFFGALDNDYRTFQLKSLHYPTYEVVFKFNDWLINNSPYKNLYFDFNGIANYGNVSFSKLSLYEYS